MTTDSTPPCGCDSAAIWQGYHHAWEYNHRLNRFGSYIRRARTGGHESAPGLTVAGHTAASGTGDDTAHFTEFVTQVKGAKGVAFQFGSAAVTAECPRGVLTPFIIRVDDLLLAPELQQRDTYTVILNGFDLYAREHSEKIMTLDLEVTDPRILATGTRARFRILGELRFDCRSPECQLLPLRLEVERVADEGAQADAMTGAEDDVLSAPVIPEPRRRQGIDRRRVDRVARWLKRQLAQMTDVEEIKRSIVGDTGDTARRRVARILGRRFLLRFLKLRLFAPYVIRAHYLIIAADRDALTVTESDDFEHCYAWDMEEEIHHEASGVLPVHIVGDDPGKYAVNTLAFRRLFLDVIFDETQGTTDPVQWGKGMHMLDWHTAIREIQPHPTGVSATLDLFYKNWSDAMNQIITLTTWGAVRAAGRARIGARLALLQFREAEDGRQQLLPGRIYWPGAGRSAVRDPQARFERVLASQDAPDVPGIPKTLGAPHDPDAPAAEA
jgi:hypothetical protein